ncbi:MAG: hypothetical protein KJ623_00700 [Nanoarchaeota archaeon]|nr:hypothetical protein [Nanoarchaeota archaeon]MBU0963031.1 hypothetical protein [Nanoarchaeota archaeon]
MRFKSIKKRMAIFLMIFLLIQIVAVTALNSSDAKKEWQQSKQNSLEMQQKYNEAKIKFAGDQSEENKQAVVDSGKDVLNAALDEVSSWLEWKKIEADESNDITDDLRNTIKNDIEKNNAKIAELRTDVAGVNNQVGLGLVFLKMIGKYTELLTDVARDSGKILVYKGNKYLDTADNYESKLRESAEKISDNQDIISKLNVAKAELNEARLNVNKAEASYEQVTLPGTPLIKFAEGNNYMRTARMNLISAMSNLNSAYNLMIVRGR